MGMPSLSKQQLQQFFDARANEAETWRAKNPYYYQWIGKLLRFYLPTGLKVIEIGSGLGDLLAAVQPASGVGLDFSPAVAAVARRRHPDPRLRFVVGDIEEGVGVRETFDAIITSDLVGYLDDIQTALENIRVLCHERTRLVVTMYNRLWEPILHAGARFGLNQPKPINNWLSVHELNELLGLAGFEVVTQGNLFLCPKRLGGLGDFINREFARWPLLRRLCLIQYVVARPIVYGTPRRFSVSVVVPLASPVGNCAEFISRIPSLGSRTEIVAAVPAKDATVLQAVAAFQAENAGRRAITLGAHSALDWGGAIAAGIKQASGELVVVLDPRSGVAPEELVKFYAVVARGKAEFVVGSRFVYPPQSRLAVQSDRSGSQRFAERLSATLGQRVADPFCRTLSFRRDDYRRWVARPADRRERVSDGGLELLISAARLGLKMTDIPVHVQLPGMAGFTTELAPAATPMAALWRACKTACAF